MRNRRDTHLERYPRKTAKDLVRVKHLLRDRFGVSDQQCPE